MGTDGCGDYSCHAPRVTGFGLLSVNPLTELYSNN